MAIRSNSLAVGVTLVLGVIVTALLGGAGAFSYRSMQDLLQDDFAHDQRNLADQLAVALALPVWNFDRDQIERILDGAMQVDHVDRVFVRLVDRNAQQFVRTRTPAANATVEDASRIDSRIIRTARTINAGGDLVGELELGFSTRLMAEKLRTYRTGIVAAVGAIDVLMVVALYLLLHRIVLRPLNEIERFATSASPEDESFRLLANRRYTGELESLRRSLDLMIRQLGERQGALRKASELLEAERSKLRTMLNIVPIGVAVVDENRMISEANPEFGRMLELPAEKLAAGQNLRRRYLAGNGDLLSPDQHPNQRAIREQREVRDFEMQVQTETGKLIWTTVSAAPLSPQSAVVAVFDITQRKIFEQELKKQVDELRRWQKVTLHREDRLRELKQEVNELCVRLGVESRYEHQPLSIQPKPATTT